MRLFTLTLLFVSSIAMAQTVTLSGHVRSSESGEDLIGAIVDVQGAGGAYTNSYGFYSLTLPKGSYTVVYSYVGFKADTQKLELTSDKSIDIELKPTSNTIGTIEIKAERDNRVEAKQISVVSMEMRQIKEIPVVFGEVDVLKTITLLPGIQSGGEASSGLNVRGGAQDQNLIMLDEATVYNASHLLGFFSVFNGDAIKDLEVYKGGIPAQYGGRLSSLIDIRMKDGNNKHFAGSGGVGTISSRLTLEGPIVKNKSSFMIAGRRSYADVFLPLSNEDLAKESKLYFYDLNLKANYELSSKNKLYLSGYFGRDVFGLGQLFGLQWGNATTTLRWNHLFSSKLFSNVSIVLSDFDYGFEVKFSENAKFGLNQDIRDIYIKPDLSYYFSSKSVLRFGGQLTHHNFNPGSFTSLDTVVNLEKRFAIETAIYVDHEYKFSDKFNVRYGLRYSGFGNIGGVNFDYQKNENYQPIDSLTVATRFSKNEIHDLYGGFEPRLALSLNVTPTAAFKASYNRTYQYVQQASNTASAFPTDQWFSVNNNILPQLADQWAVGFFKNFDGGIETSVETYYKDMQNQIDYREGAVLAFNENLDGELLFGEGRSYGLELFVSKPKGKTNGFLSYTLSRTERRIEGINGGTFYAAGQDRTHNLSIVLSQKLGQRIVITGSFVYYTGNPFTPPSGKFFYRDRWNNFYGPRNSLRVPDYHRADLSITINPKEREDKKFGSSWNISAYNVYNRENAYSIYFEQATAEQAEEFGVEEGESIAVQVALFKFLPSITWNFNF